jgi:hypothetical protein
VSRAAELSRARAFHGLSETDCQIWFGVSLATMERLEAGEIEPSDELDERIQRFLTAHRGGASCSTPGAPLAHGGVPTGGGGTIRAPAATLEERE